MKTIRVALAQINPTVGDFARNAQLIIDYVNKARNAGADIVAVPELAISGYPPEDLLLKPHFMEENRGALDEVIAASDGIAVIAGFID
ncbi:MAG: nitrilase-related carbon-nitrogen hydrolase, partial [Blastocatellia bacterium]